MENFDQLVKKFRASELGKQSGLSLSSEDDLRRAISKAYEDLMVRTIKGHTPKVKAECCEAFYPLIVGFLQNAPTKQNFDKRHADLCNKILCRMNKVMQRNGLAEQQYGKAQKLVNMTFKYLYCFDNHDKEMPWLAYAHMPLDIYTLKWYRKKAKDKTEYVWSNLSQPQYEKIAEDIRKLLSNGCDCDGIRLPKSPLKADFIIWAAEKQEAKKKELLDAAKKISSYVGCPAELRPQLEKFISELQ